MIAQELLALVQALAIAVDHSFMSREHGASVWKRALRATAFDVPQQLTTKKEVTTQNAPSKKD